MRNKPFGLYPDNWDEIARQVKNDADWRCVRCNHIDEAATGYMLTVHHIDNNKSNCEWWNLAALCQRCHLSVQARVDISQPWMLDHSKWFRPYVAGYYAEQNELPTQKPFVLANMDSLILLGQGRMKLEEFISEVVYA